MGHQCRLTTTRNSGQEVSWAVQVHRSRDEPSTKYMYDTSERSPSVESDAEVPRGVYHFICPSLYVYHV